MSVPHTPVAPTATMTSPDPGDPGAATSRNSRPKDGRVFCSAFMKASSNCGVGSLCRADAKIVLDRDLYHSAGLPVMCSAKKAQKRTRRHRRGCFCTCGSFVAHVRMGAKRRV